MTTNLESLKERLRDPVARNAWGNAEMFEEIAAAIEQLEEERETLIAKANRYANAKNILRAKLDRAKTDFFERNPAPHSSAAPGPTGKYGTFTIPVAAPSLPKEAAELVERLNTWSLNAVGDVTGPLMQKAAALITEQAIANERQRQELMQWKYECQQATERAERAEAKAR